MDSKEKSMKKLKEWIIEKKEELKAPSLWMASRRLSLCALNRVNVLVEVGWHRRLFQRTDEYNI